MFGYGGVGSERRKIDWWTPPASWTSRRALQSRLPCSGEVVESKLPLFQMEKVMEMKRSLKIRRFGLGKGVGPTRTNEAKGEPFGRVW